MNFTQGRRALATSVCLALFAIFSVLLPKPAFAQDAKRSRQVVMLSPQSVDRMPHANGEAIETVYNDGRVQKAPHVWQPVSVKTAKLIKELEQAAQFQPFLAFGHLNHGFVAHLTDAQIELLKDDSRVQSVFPDVIGRVAASDIVATTPVGSTPGNITCTTSLPTNCTPSVAGWNLQEIGLQIVGPASTANYTNLVNTAYPASDYRNYRDGTYPVKVYILDTGVKAHWDLNVLASEARTFDCDPALGGSGSTTDLNCGAAPVYVDGVPCDSHGTYVAGVVGAIRNTPRAFGVEGVAPNAQIVSIRMRNSCDGPGSFYYGSLVTAINYVASANPCQARDEWNKCRLTAIANVSALWVNLSQDHIDGLTNAIRTAADNGVFFSFAAGNSNADAGTNWPGAAALNIGGAMSVNATRAGGLAMYDPGPELGGTGFSRYAMWGPNVEIWAPGQAVHSTFVQPVSTPNPEVPGNWGINEYRSQTTAYTPGQMFFAPATGSSMAAPHVAGAALLVARKFQKAGVPLPSPASIEVILKGRTRYLGEYTPAGTCVGCLVTPIHMLRVEDL